MVAIIDTCSLVSCARYYAPFDANDKFSDFVKEQIQDGVFVLLDKVALECKRQGQGVASKVYHFLNDANKKTLCDGIKLPQKFYHMIDDNFQNKEARKLLEEDEYQFERDSYIQSADFAIIAYAFSHKNDDIVVITEESEYSNDGKPFKKIPAICKIIGVKSMTIAEYLIQDKRFRMSVDYDSSQLF